jgi:cupin fold WbuC family metalloprotein
VSEADIQLRKINDEVFIAEDQIVRLGPQQIDFLKRQAAANARGRARICAHQSDDDRLHEMLIAISAHSYVHPHKHVRKIESFHIVEGIVDVVMFDDAGSVVDIIELGDVSTRRNFYYRLPSGLFHTLLIHTEFLIVHEVTNGPFIRDENLLAPFAPPEARNAEALAYMSNVARIAATRRAQAAK